MARLRSAIATHPHFRPQQHDALFLLRFVLSYPAHAAAVKALGTALNIRAAKRLDEVAREVTSTGFKDWCGRRHRYWVHLMPVDIIQPDAYGPAIMYVDMREVDMHALLHVPRHEYAEASTHCKTSRCLVAPPVGTTGCPTPPATMPS